MPESSQPEHEKERVQRLREAMYSRALSEKIHPRERHELGETKPVVEGDWKRPEPEMEPILVAPVGIGLGKSLLYWLLGSAIVFFVGAAGFFMYYFTIGGGSLPASPQNISISVSGPPQVAGGSVTQLQVAVVNRNKVPLQLAELVLKFPPGTRSPTDFKTDEPSLRQPLGTIEPGGVRQGTVSAVFAGKEGAREDIQVELEYRVAGSNSIYVASSGYTLNFTSAPLAIAVDGVNEAISGQPVQFTVTVTSNSVTPMREVLMSAEYPFGFKLSSATPAPTRGNLWELGDFNPGQQKTVVVNGTLTGDSGDDRIFHFIAGTSSSTPYKKVDTPLSVVTFKSGISQAFLKLGLIINESTSKKVVVAPGDKVTVAVSYQNNLSKAIDNAVIVAKLSGINIDGANVRSSDGFYRSADGAVFWDKTTTNGRLEHLDPGEKGTVQFTFEMPTSDQLVNTQSPHLDISVNAAGSRIEENGVPQTLQSTARSSISLASELQLIAEGLYYTNPFGSAGPMPPKANTETTYAVVFTITNTTNKISGATLTAQLPPYVRWVGIYSPAAENVTFNQLESTVTWRLGDIDANVGLNGTQPRQAAIAIGFTPSTSQIGQQPVILQNIVLKGTDESGVALSKKIDDLTSNLSKVSKSSTDILVSGDAGFTAANAVVVK
jgi:hypothetical protein